MPDSPKCPRDDGQTYRVFGGSSGLFYHCRVCGNIFAHSEFKPEDFLWKEQPEVYRQHKIGKKAKVKA